jgi:hypothetical protein
MQTFNKVQHSLLTPAIHKFHLPKVSGVRVGKYGWIKMRELDEAATALLRRQQYTGNRLNFIPCYQSFELSILISQKNLPFAWLTHDEDPDSESRTCVEITSVKNCPFTRTNLYVISGWATRVLKLVQHGVIILERAQRRSPIGIAWHGEEYPTQNLMEMLFKDF